MTGIFGGNILLIASLEHFWLQFKARTHQGKAKEPASTKNNCVVAPWPPCLVPSGPKSCTWTHQTDASRLKREIKFCTWLNSLHLCNHRWAVSVFSWHNGKLVSRLVWFAGGGPASGSVMYCGRITDTSSSVLPTELVPVWWAVVLCRQEDFPLGLQQQALRHKLLQEKAPDG